jgi:hypothetical protein
VKPAASAPFSTEALSTVHFSIRPWGNIIVDGQIKGISPPLTRLQLSQGHHTISITNQSFDTVTKEITVTGSNDLVVSHRFGHE